MTSPPIPPDRPASPLHASPRARRTQVERSATTRAQLLAAAADIVRERSYQAATIFEVAKLAGVTPGALQHHFGSKAELMMSLLEHILTSVGPGAIVWPDPTLPLRERARAFVHALWAGAYEPPRFLVAWGIYFGGVDDDALRARILAIRQRLGAELTQRTLICFPELRGLPRPQAFIDLLLASLRGLGVSRLFDPTEARSADAMPPALDELALLIEQRCLNASPSQPSPPRTTSPRSSTRRRKAP